DDVMAILRATVAAGYVDVTTGDYPLPYITDLGGRAMRAQIPVAMRLPRVTSAKPRRDRTRSRAKSPAPPAATDESATRRFDALRAVRGKLARESSLPAYVIAHDKALLAAAEANPKTESELEACSGWGPTKVARYGAPILEALAALDRGP